MRIIYDPFHWEKTHLLTSDLNNINAINNKHKTYFKSKFCINKPISNPIYLLISKANPTKIFYKNLINSVITRKQNLEIMK